jgi:response regulator RpfG family c-di-GMP phosphodiesterase
MVAELPSRKPRIVIAGTPTAIGNFSRALGDAAELLTGRTVEEALRLCEEPVDLVLCNVRFDESRVFELLEALHARPPERRLPVVCVRLFRAMSPSLLAATREALTVVGVTRFVDLFELRQRQGLEHALRELRTVVLEEAAAAAGARGPA